jgi:hypothetical protein
LAILRNSKLLNNQVALMPSNQVQRLRYEWFKLLHRSI